MARIRHVSITNFRAAKELSWFPGPGLNCLIGPGAEPPGKAARATRRPVPCPSAFRTHAPKSKRHLATGKSVAATRVVVGPYYPAGLFCAPFQTLDALERSPKSGRSAQGPGNGNNGGG